MRKCGIIDSRDKWRFCFGDDFREWGIHYRVCESEICGPGLRVHEAYGESGTMKRSGCISHDVGEGGGGG